MTLTNACLLSLCAIGAAAAWMVGGVQGTGILLATLMATGLTGIGLAYQRQILATRPSLAVGVLGLFMVVKMFALFGAAAVLRYVPAAAERADWKAFALAFAPVAFVALMVGATDTVRRQRVAAAQPAKG